ncbi:uncharacterized protein BKA55DRAFT_564437 [Fusarium redolens]|uniref:Uncharacterized protein n=1 Tax=Fusarium redolens TaxID=48865 RepID=A0A9P9HDM7_FUSRE|nr:uncharacterized protein BKA55DRAFT_564437 [Fusarium redolens]KAH7255575.1 hypothetical protein BKA55DRAFT_564437 [Fusarium redolens]
MLSRSCTFSNGYLDQSFLQQQRHTPAVLFTHIVLFLPITDHAIAFGANTTKESAEQGYTQESRST